MAKEILFDLEAYQSLKAGIDKLANVVGKTLGAKGKNVLLGKKNGITVITKDGVSVAKEISLQNRLEDMGAQMIKEVASKTAEEAGDGTTTATVLAQAIYTEGLKYITAGANPMALKRGIDKAVRVVVKELQDNSRKVSSIQKIEQIALISSNQDAEIGKVIADAINEVGAKGMVMVEDAKGIVTDMKIKSGIHFDSGYTSSVFCNEGEENVTLENAFILVTNKKISFIRDIFHTLSYVAQNERSLLIIADDISHDVMNLLTTNKLRSGLKVVAVKSPCYGSLRTETLEDIAVLIGATVVSDAKGMILEKMDVGYLGLAEKVTVTKDKTTIVNGKGSFDDIQARAQIISTQIENTPSAYDQEKLQERLARFIGGIAIIRVGAISEIEAKERRDRVDDALQATKSAIQEGYIIGGGVALLHASHTLENLPITDEDERMGVKLIQKALQAPIRAIAHNCGVNGSVVIAKIKELGGDYGYNARTDTYEDLMKAGVIDPTKVTRLALENSASVAGTLLTAGAVIVSES